MTGSAASDFTLIVDFQLKPGAAAAFLAAVAVNARASTRDEPGCLQFDVLVPEEPDRVVLYERYVDEAAFAAHLETPHFKSFVAASEGLVIAERVERFTARSVNLR